MKILLAIDGSRYSLPATRLLCAYLAHPASQVDVVHVAPPVMRADAAFPRHQPENIRIPPAARAWFDRMIKSLEARAFKVTRHVRRRPARAVVPALAAKGRFDLVIAGVKCRSGAPFLPMGSVALQVARHAPCSVFIVR